MSDDNMLDWKGIATSEDPIIQDQNKGSGPDDMYDQLVRLWHTNEYRAGILTAEFENWLMSINRQELIDRLVSKNPEVYNHAFSDLPWNFWNGHMVFIYIELRCLNSINDKLDTILEQHKPKTMSDSVGEDDDIPT